MQLTKEQNKKITEFITMTIGVVFLTIGVYFFKIPNGFSTGGVSGIGTLLGKVTPISPATWIAGINFLLLIIGFFFRQCYGRKNCLLFYAFFGTNMAF